MQVTLDLQKLVDRQAELGATEAVAVVSLTSCGSRSCHHSQLESLERLAENVATPQSK